MTSTRPAECGHGGVMHAKGLCEKCYHAARYRERREEFLARNAAYRAANPEATRARVAAWKERNRERIRLTSREYYKANVERISARNADWRRQNPVGHAAREAARRAAKAGAEVELTADGWREILAEFDYRCAYCNLGDLPLQQEHMLPIVRGGHHTASNVVPACGPCNREKYTRTALEWIGPDSFRLNDNRSAA